MAKHRLVALGDSMTQGFMSGAIFATDLSYPALIAREMGLDPSQFRVPAFAALGGLPVNLEPAPTDAGEGVRTRSEQLGPPWGAVPDQDLDGPDRGLLGAGGRRRAGRPNSITTSPSGDSASTTPSI